MSDGTRVLVPAARWERWVAGFERRNGPVALSAEGGELRGSTPRGAWFRARLPFGGSLRGAPDAAAFAAAAEPPEAWGVLLVRRGGFAVARMAGTHEIASKVGRRHVQGRTKAGGQSQQRFARRRQNQARVAFDAAADHAARLLLDPAPVPVVLGGDRPAVAAALEDPRLAVLPVVGDWLDVPDPRRAVLERAVADAQALRVEVRNAPSDDAATAPG